MSDPTEKIKYALSLVDGATPGPFHWYWDTDPAGDAGLISMTGGGILISADAGYWPDYNSPSSRLLDLGASLIPAALRLALALLEEYEDYGPTAVETPLLDFLVLLPEPPKEATE